MSNPARARASAARGGAVKPAPESSTWPVSAAIGLSRFPNVMSAFRNVSSSRRNEYSVSPAISRSRAVRRPRLMSPTAYRRSVPRAGGACATASSMLHATRRFRVIAVESQRTCAPPSTVDQPREHFRRVRRVEPFQNHDPGRRRTGQGSLPHAPQAVGEARDQLVRFVAQLHGLADLADVDEHLDERVRVQRHDPGCDTERGDDSGELLLAYRTHVADRLSDDDVRTQPADQLDVHFHCGGPLAPRRRQRHVDLAGRESGVEAGTGHARQRTGLGWIVAFVGHADEAPERAQGGHDLGGGRQQGNDAHRYLRSARMPKCRGAAYVGAWQCRGAACCAPTSPLLWRPYHCSRRPTAYSSAPSSPKRPKARRLEWGRFP